MDDRTVEAAGKTRRLIVNPTSGTADHVERTRQLASEYGFTVKETKRAGHGVDLAKKAAADGVDILGVCGGDGTIHEVVQGLVAAGALDTVTLAVIPTGTANIIASALGISDLNDGFEVATQGETRRLDLGMANGEPFVMSAIAGLPAEASAAASPELKKRFGTFAFVIEGVQETRTFEGLQIEIEAAAEDGEIIWSGEALSLLVGNLRRFNSAGRQANAEDGVFDVSIVEQMPPIEAATEAVEQRLFHQDTEHITTLTAVSLDVTSLDEKGVRFSLDGEIRTYERVQFSIRPRQLGVRVGESYVPEPEYDGG